MKKLTMLVVLLLMLPAVLAGSVSRSFSTVTPCRDVEFNVMLTVDVDAETFYTIDEIIPGGVIVANSGGGDSITNPGHVFWTVLNAQDRTFTYTVKSSNLGQAQFSGTFGFEAGAETAISGSSVVTVTDCVPGPDPLTTRVESLEAWKTTANSQISLLQQWKTTIDNLIASIQQWLGFSSYNNLCQALGGCGLQQPECQTASDCGADSYVGDNYCSNNDVYKNYRTYSCTDSNCDHTDTPTLVEDCPDQCSNGACSAQAIACYADSDCGTNQFEGSLFCSNNDVYQNQRRYYCMNAATPDAYCTDLVDPVLRDDCDSGEVCDNGECIISEQTVIFRTNAVNGQYNKYKNEIVLDYDGDGNLECYEYYTYYKSYRESKPETIVQTPEGKNVNKYGSLSDKRVIIVGYPHPIYKPAQDCSTPLTTVPTEPYASDGQEVYS